MMTRDAWTRPLDAKNGTGHSAGLSLFHVVIIILSLVMTISAWQFSKRQLETKVNLRFEAERDRVVSLITERMQKYEDALWAGTSAVASHGGDISYRDWSDFARTLRIDEKYLGINGIGIVHYVQPGHVGSYLDRMREERADYGIHPAHDEALHIPISYITPVEPNAKAVGLDLAFETNRRTAALAARDSGEARITGPIVLVQDEGSTPGFLFYVPFYKGERPNSRAERREKIVGSVYAPFVTRKLMQGLLAKERRSVHFSITDNGQTIYDEHIEDDPSNDPKPMFAEEISLDLYGRTWVLDMRTTREFRETNTYGQPTLILAGGLLIEGLIIALLVLMAQANRKAVGYANKVTAALRTESEKLADANATLSHKNRELEQFAYVASHDLKTPIRGIGGLTEMLEDDLEGYFASPDANPDVAMNLQRIRERVQRMNALTAGIMEFSRIGRFENTQDSVDLPGIVTALRNDLGLADDQLCFDGDAPTVTVDAFSFRRVIENLVDNAVKYHNDIDTLRIDVTSYTVDNRLKVSVSDNGPGIAPEYHEKVFEMFQTLGNKRHGGGTGIGLAIVKKAIDHNGGHMVLTSEEGKGATFTFDWPVETNHKIAANEGKAA